MIVLSLDISTNSTGWAVYDTIQNTFLDLGSFDYKRIDPYASLSRDLESIVRQFNVDEIVAEDCFCGPNVETFKVLSRMQGVLMSFAASYRVDGEVAALPVEFMMPSEWRKIAGKKQSVKLNYRGTAECKKASVELANKVIAGRPAVVSDDVADAICIMLAYV
jgi:Holliday junction resolvasome RuvABC endonuclease subunit